MSDAGFYRRVTAAALVAAPLLFLIATIVHPKEYSRGHEGQQVREIASSYTAWQLAHALAFVAVLIFAAAVAGLAFLVRRRQPWLGLLGGAAAIAGLIGVGAVLAIDGFSWGIVSVSASQSRVGEAAGAVVLHSIQYSKWAWLYYVTPVGFVAGLLALAVGAVRQGAVPPWAGALLGLAAILTGTETLITSNTYFVVGAAVLLAGGAAVALALWRMSDEEFAAGGAQRAGS